MKKIRTLELCVENKKKYLIYIVLIGILILGTYLIVGKKEKNTQKVFPAPSDSGPYNDK